MIGIIVLMSLLLLGIVVAYVYDYKRDPKYFVAGIKGITKKILGFLFIGYIADFFKKQ